jgi:hypothetical protein
MDEQQPSIQFEKPKKGKNFLPLLGWAALLLVTAWLFIILKKYCGLKPQWLVAVLFLDYLALLFANYVNWFKKRRWVFGLLLALAAVLMVLATHPWSFWFWALIVVLYLFTLLQYFLKTLDDNAWSVIIPLTIFLALMIFKLQRFACTG